MAQIRIVVYVTEAEREWVEGECGDVALSRWCHRKIFAGMKIGEVHGVSGVREGIKVPAAEGREPTSGGVSKPTRAVPTCAHGKAKGYNCGLCGGLAKV